MYWSGVIELGKGQSAGLITCEESDERIWILVLVHGYIYMSCTDSRYSTETIGTSMVPW